jgi:formyl-CoA transferase
LLHLSQIFSRTEPSTVTGTKFEAMEILNKLEIPCGFIAWLGDRQ